MNIFSFANSVFLSIVIHFDIDVLNFHSCQKLENMVERHID